MDTVLSMKTLICGLDIRNIEVFKNSGTVEALLWFLDLKKLEMRKVGNEDFDLKFWII
jgi:hypothetical protein